MAQQADEENEFDNFVDGINDASLKQFIRNHKNMKNLIEKYGAPAKMMQFGFDLSSHGVLQNAMQEGSAVLDSIQKAAIFSSKKKQVTFGSKDSVEKYRKAFSFENDGFHLLTKQFIRQYLKDTTKYTKGRVLDLFENYKFGDLETRRKKKEAFESVFAFLGLSNVLAVYDTDQGLLKNEYTGIETNDKTINGNPDLVIVVKCEELSKYDYLDNVDGAKKYTEYRKEFEARNRLIKYSAICVIDCKNPEKVGSSFKINYCHGQATGQLLIQEVLNNGFKRNANNRRKAMVFHSAMVSETEEYSATVCYYFDANMYVQIKRINNCEMMKKIALLAGFNNFENANMLRLMQEASLDGLAQMGNIEESKLIKN